NGHEPDNPLPQSTQRQISEKNKFKKVRIDPEHWIDVDYKKVTKNNIGNVVNSNTEKIKSSNLNIGLKPTVTPNTLQEFDRTFKSKIIRPYENKIRVNTTADVMKKVKDFF